MPRIILGPIAVACGLLAAPVDDAQAQTGRGMTLNELAGALSAAGMLTQRDGDDLRGEIDGMEFHLSGYNCQIDRCTEYLIQAGFDLKDPFPMERINTWNWSEPAGRASLDAEGDPYIDHIFSVSSPDDEGVVREVVLLWEAIINEFSDYIDLPVRDASV